MIHLVVVRNPFDVKQKDIREKKYKKGAPICAYFKERGAWLYSIDGIIAGRRSVPQDGAYVVVVPRVQKKMFGLILSIGLSFLTAGIASGTILGGLSVGWRMVTALAIGMIGAARISTAMGLLPAETCARIEQLIEAMGLPCSVEGALPDAMYDDLFHDKKTVDGRIHWVLAEDIGRVCVRSDVPEEIVRENILGLFTHVRY